MSATNRTDDLGTFLRPFVLQKGLDLVVFNDAPTDPWYFEITTDPNAGPPAVLISSPAIPYNLGSGYNNFAEYSVPVDSVTLVSGTRYQLHVLDNTLAVISSGIFTLFELDITPGAGLGADINALVKEALGLHGENARLVNDVVVAGIPTEQTLTIYTDETLSSVLEVFDIRRYLDSTNRVIAEVSRRRP